VAAVRIYALSPVVFSGGLMDGKEAPEKPSPFKTLMIRVGSATALVCGPARYT